MVATASLCVLPQLLDTSEPFGPYKVLQEIYLPKGSGPHAISISPDEKLAAVGGWGG